MNDECERMREETVVPPFDTQSRHSSGSIKNIYENPQPGSRSQKLYRLSDLTQLVMLFSERVDVSSKKLIKIFSTLNPVCEIQSTFSLLLSFKK
jgi:hypothetical protein